MNITHPVSPNPWRKIICSTDKNILSGLSLSVRKNSSSPRYRDINEDCSCSHWAHSARLGGSLGSTFQSRKMRKNKCSSQNIKTMHHTAWVLCTMCHWYSLHMCSKMEKPNNQNSGTSLLVFPEYSSYCQFLQSWLPAENMWIGNNNLQSHHRLLAWNRWWSCLPNSLLSCWVKDLSLPYCH